MVSFVLAVGSALLFSFLCSISEAVLLSLSHAQVESFGKSRTGDTLREFKREIDVPIAAILVLNTIAHTIGASVAGASYGEVFDESTLWIFSLVFTVAVLIFTEIIPKTFGVAAAVKLAPFVAFFVYWLAKLLTPILFVTKALSRLLRRGSDESPVTSIEEIRTLAALGRTEGVVGPRVASMIEGAALLRELTAYDVMVPRGGVVYLSEERALEDNLALIRSTGHSRFPFTKTGDLDEVVGVILTKDLMFQLHQTPNEPHWEELAGEALVVPASTPLNLLLRTFQEKRRHLALVVDEYGGVQGIVTLEDVLEEIVGEIQDESDRVDATILRRSDGSLQCKGWAETRKVFELVGIDAESDFVTVGGFVADQLDRVPRVGDTVRFAGWEFIVRAATPRRAERVDVRPLPGSIPPAAPLESDPGVRDSVPESQEPK